MRKYTQGLEAQLNLPFGEKKKKLLEKHKLKTYPSQWLIFMVTRWSIIGWVYSGKPAMYTLEKTAGRGGETWKAENALPTGGIQHSYFQNQFAHFFKSTT